MREIKFRAYDTIDNRWLKPMDRLVIADEMDLGWKWLTGSHEDNFIIFNDAAPWIEISQFTGILDKNGKEIFEGDILHYKWDLDKNGSESKHLKTVLFHNGCFGYYQRPDYFLNFEDAILPEHEVISNIYESPDLVAK